MNNRESLRAIGQIGGYTAVDTGICKWADERIEELERQLDIAKSAIAHESDCAEAFKSEADELRTKLDDAEKQIVMLREALNTAIEYYVPTTQEQQFLDALDTTADLSGYILCDAKPVAHQFSATNPLGETRTMVGYCFPQNAAGVTPLYKEK